MKKPILSDYPNFNAYYPHFRAYTLFLSCKDNKNPADILELLELSNLEGRGKFKDPGLLWMISQQDIQWAKRSGL